ncbi:uncharacterized protein (DUF305 family) [Lipingzhangella halophila]|uniref:Uncharacterized protein (DUF305 family) n=1 Tax=Lipingzhangella halophila TaxID=1783352 RepID=A0A7W7RJM7_9ACTN|nr:DUF305 domain-containing protein [Lipingzhangella halophila]MBB4933214.1 uncharacterized protein (DUF305 family) [Lipingzhangella halophila]
MHRGILAAGAVVVIAATACTGTNAADDPPIIDPGAPGDSPAPVPTEDLEQGEDPDHNEADAKFMVHMIEHHKQALEMSELAEDRADRDAIVSIAERIYDGQDAEIKAMQGWVNSNVENPEDYEIDHSEMKGMASPEEMDELEGSSGDDFDQLFVDLMVTHHEGGVTMAENVLINGSSDTISGFANEVISTQRGEIARLENIIDD